MKKILLVSLGVCSIALAETVLPDNVFWGQLIAFLGGLKGASLLAIVYGVSQLAMVFFQTQLSDFAGLYKLLIVAGLNVGGAILTQMLSGVGFFAALTNGSVLTLFSVFVNELMKHIGEFKAQSKKLKAKK